MAGVTHGPADDAFSRRHFLRGAGALVAAPVAARLLRAVAPGRPAPARASRDTTTVTLTAAPATIDLGGRTVTTWAYDGAVPGRILRVRAGVPFSAHVVNQLPVATTVHWHGIAVPFAMDGVPGVTQDPIPPGGTFDYTFTPKQPGTYFLHPHVGLQLDRGLYAPLVVDDPHEPGAYDDEWVVVLDDWTDGVGPSPDQILASLTGTAAASPSGTTMPGMDMGGTSPAGATAGSTGSVGPAAAPMVHGSSPLLGGDSGDVLYPLYLVNGRSPAHPTTFTTRPGARIRLRVVNAGAETAFRVALGGHRLRVTHADGFAVAPVDADAVLLGMGERVDATFTARDGVHPLVAIAEGKGGAARALLRTSAGTSPPANARPAELDRKVVALATLQPASSARLRARKPDRTFRVVLAGSHRPYRWTIDGKTYGDDSPLIVDVGQRIRLDFVNRSPMYHPMHLHGHTFAVLDRARVPGVRKDTVIVRPGGNVGVDFHADNSGDWMLHCHNAYHQEAGMMTSVYYSGA